MNRWMRRCTALAAAALLAACGGGGDAPQACDIASQKAWLRDYMADHYFWYRDSPSPDPAGYGTLDSYFNALLYRGANPAFPDADRWSYFQPTADFERFFGDGQSLGYGVFVAAFEVTDPAQPLYVRYVEPQSPGATAGVVRGDRVMSVNGRSVASMISANDFTALTALDTGDRATLVLRNAAGIDRTVTLTAAVFPLSPVPPAQVRTLSTPNGRLMGYVMVKDMLSQALPRLDTVFGQFRAAGVQEIVLDLRYNGGGFVSVANTLASQVAGARAAGQPFATLAYNDRQQASNVTFRFANPALSTSLGLPRVYVLTGARTCSASEQVINGLRPFANVVLVGDTTCGKPVGFLPVDGGCGVTYSAVNFESLNADRQGRYFDGFAASSTCAVAEDFTVPLGADADPLLLAARTHADTGVCGATAAARVQPLSQKLRSQGRALTGEGEHPAMLPR